MEKIKLNDGTIIEIQSGSDEYVNIVAASVDEVVAHFTDENLTRCEILAQSSTETEGESAGTATEEVARAVFTNKRMKNFKAASVDGGWDIVITFEDVDSVAQRLAALEESQAIQDEAITEIAAIVAE